ncbi:MAG: hypothetical protein PHX21_13095 [bacterium]|nr:hypothetical protein [bacterium]
MKNKFQALINDMKSGKIPMEHVITLTDGTKIDLHKNKVTISQKGIAITKRGINDTKNNPKLDRNITVIPRNNMRKGQKNG